MMSTYYSPTGNPEIWLEKPDGYYTPEEWELVKPAEPTPTLDEVKAAKKEELAAARYAAEVGGIDYLGVRMHTDRDSQAKYTAAIVTLQLAGAYSASWKGVDGWLTISSPEVMMGLAAAVQEHVAEVYALEQALAGQVGAAETAEEVAAITWEGDSQ